MANRNPPKPAHLAQPDAVPVPPRHKSDCWCADCEDRRAAPLMDAIRDLLRMYSEGVHTAEDRQRFAEIRTLAGQAIPENVAGGAK